MKYSDYCEPFLSGSKKTSGLKGNNTKGGIAEYFLKIALDERAKIELAFGVDTFRKWFNGDRTPTPELWASVEKNYDEVVFTRELSVSLNDKALDSLLDAFGINRVKGEIADKYALASALAKQFKAITDGCGEAENFIESFYRSYLNVNEFPDYISNSQNKYSKMKTLLYTSEERPFDEFFVCNTISTERWGFHRRHLHDKFKIENVTLEKLAEKSKFVLLVGMGGIGKSMMMRHLFLSSIKKYSETGLLPILVTLREFGAESRDLFNNNSGFCSQV